MLRAAFLSQRSASCGLGPPPATSGLTLPMVRSQVSGSMNASDPVVLALLARLSQVRETYRLQPDETTRYQMVRTEELIRSWLPQLPLSS